MPARRLFGGFPLWISRVRLRLRRNQYLRWRQRLLWNRLICEAPLIVRRRSCGWPIGKRCSEGRLGRGHRGRGDREGMSKWRDVAVLILVPPVSSLVPDIAALGLPLHLDLDPFCVLVCLLPDRCLVLLGALEALEFGFGV